MSRTADTSASQERLPNSGLLVEIISARMTSLAAAGEKSNRAVDHMLHPAPADDYLEKLNRWGQHFPGQTYVTPQQRWGRRNPDEIDTPTTPFDDEHMPDQYAQPVIPTSEHTVHTADAARQRIATLYGDAKESESARAYVDTQGLVAEALHAELTPGDPKLDEQAAYLQQAREALANVYGGNQGI